MPAKDGTSVHYHQAHLAVKYKTLRFPLDPRTVARHATEKGWIIPTEMALLPLGGAMTGSGLIATKGSSQIRFSTDTKVISVVGLQEQQVIADFNELESIITDVIDFDSSAHAEYYELIAEGYCPGKRSPLEALHALGQKSQLAERFKGIVGEDTSVFGVHLMKDRGNPGDVEWWDLSLSIQVFRPDKYYVFSLVQRSRIRDKVIDVARRTSAIIKDAIGRVEPE